VCSVLLLPSVLLLLLSVLLLIVSVLLLLLSVLLLLPSVLLLLVSVLALLLYSVLLLRRSEWQSQGARAVSETSERSCLGCSTRGETLLTYFPTSLSL
jgi:membrane protein implicated in regulation of membrane protease activity